MHSNLQLGLHWWWWWWTAQTGCRAHLAAKESTDWSNQKRCSWLISRRQIERMAVKWSPKAVDLGATLYSCCSIPANDGNNTKCCLFHCVSRPRPEHSTFRIKSKLLKIKHPSQQRNTVQWLYLPPQRLHFFVHFLPFHKYNWSHNLLVQWLFPHLAPCDMAAGCCLGN